MKRAIDKTAVCKSGLIMALMLFAFTHVALSQGLMQAAFGASPDRTQEHFLKTVTDNEINGDPVLVYIDVSALRENTFMFDPGTGETFIVVKNDRGVKHPTMPSWCGTIQIPDSEPGQVNMVIDGDELVAHFAIREQIYQITPLGGGLHAFYEVFSEKVESEECRDIHELDNDSEERWKMDAVQFPDLKQKVQNSEAKATGECDIRVLIGYTNAARLSFTNILAQLNNLINIANASYDNASVGFNIELAAAIYYPYTESGNIYTDLGRWRSTSDGYMDAVHSDRSLYDADLCALITSGGGGLAYLSLSYGNAFSVTGVNNFGVYTFHHELGHNMLCTHDLVNTSEPGTAPYAGYGSPSGCFRTIMAYGQACGTGPCPRVNIWSRSVGTYNCNGINYVKGGTNNRNRDRLALSRSTVISHETVGTNTYYAGDYNWNNREAVHMAANESFRYDGGSSNQWEMFSGSEGSFRASGSVILGEGFFAREGSTFTAYLESCTSPDQMAAEGEVAMDDPEDVPDAVQSNPIAPDAEVVSKTGVSALSNLLVYPNPFENFTTLEFQLEAESPLAITVRDLMGREVLILDGETTFPAGNHQIELPTGDWAVGVYLLTLRSGDQVAVQRIVKHK